MSSEIKVDSKEELLQEQLKLLTLKVQEHRLEKVWLQFAENDFKPLLIKGWATGYFYPNPAERLYSDFDLVFDPNDYKRAEDFLAKTQTDFTVDLHNGARHLDSLSFAELYERSVLKKCGNIEIIVPCDEDLLRIICVHWLTDGAAYEEKLWDIYHAVNNRRADFNWSKCLDAVNEKRRGWVLCAIGLAHKYLDLPIESLPAEYHNQMLDIPKWVIKTVEKEWKSDVRILPIHRYLRNRKELWKQIKKRIPPNPIQATIEVNGTIDNTPRFFYQIANVVKRFFPSWQRVTQTLKRH